MFVNKNRLKRRQEENEKRSNKNRPIEKGATNKEVYSEYKKRQFGLRRQLETRTELKESRKGASNFLMTGPSSKPMENVVPSDHQ